MAGGVRRRVGGLSHREVINATLPAGKTSALLGDGGNLYLQITAAVDGGVNKSWTFRYERDGKRRELGLGPLHTFSLGEARDRARELRQQIKLGADPYETRQNEKRLAQARLAETQAQITFADCARRYIEAHRKAWSNPKHVAQWGSTLETYAFPVLGKLAVADIDTAHIVKVLEPIWLEKPETASRTRGRIEKVLGWATVRGFRSGDNPARWRGHLQELFPAKGRVREVTHHSALPFADVPAFVAELRSRDSLSARALEFTILTAARTGETIGTTWDEINLSERIWVIPGSRMKAGKEHKVPLNDRAVAILQALPRDGERVFPLSNMAMLQLLRGLRPGLTVHGFRSAFMDWAHERTSFPKVAIDMALAHTVGDKVEAAYRRGDLYEKRRALMAAWETWCSRPAPSGATVTPISQAVRA